jgi:hypothetical protein
MDGYGELDAFIAKVQALGTLPTEVATRAAPKVEEANRRTAKAGTTADGKPWAPKRDGSRALLNAAEAVHAVAHGTVITLRLDATATGSQKVQAIQNFGTKRIPARPILPQAGAGLPAPIVQAITGAASLAFEKRFGGT